MKTITLKSNAVVIRSKRIILLLSLFTCGASFAQLQNNGILFVRDNGILSLKTGNYGFGSNAGVKKSETTRTNTSYGKIVFGSTATSSGATNLHFLDGYGRTLSADPFTMLVGQAGVLAPVRIDATTASLTGVDVAFYKSDPAVIDNSTLASDVVSISTSEYWDIQGTAAKIALSYRAATVAGLSNLDYTILGLNKTTSIWEVIPSVIDGASTSISGAESTATLGSVSSIGDVDFAAYRYFTIGAKELPCQPLVAPNAIVKRWTGTNWVLAIGLGNEVTTPPSAENIVIIDGEYNAGSFTCNTLELNADVTLSDGEFIDCVYGTTGSGKIIMSSQANFVQRDNSAAAPQIVLTKQTREMRRFDYVYWGTPISGNFLSQIDGARIVAVDEEAVPDAGAFDLLYKYNSGTAEGVSGWAGLDATTTGRGFISRVKSQGPLANAANLRNIDMKFTGTANNGIVTVDITNNSATPNSGNSHNLLANPYPSAIDADRFLIENTQLDGVIYLWKQQQDYPGSGFYQQADYVAYTRLGSTTSSSPVFVDGGTTPAPVIPVSAQYGKIASGQGFKVKSLVTGGTATFNNCMRLLDNNDQFTRNANEIVDTYKVTMSGPNGISSTILVGYTPETTLAYDRMYDATSNSVSTAQVFTILDNSTTKLAINARPSFENTDTVKMGFTKNNNNAETFLFAIQDKEGIFNTPDVNVYIHDKVQNTYHNLNNGSFSFTTTAANVLNRFELVYQTDSSLSNPGFETAQTFVVLNNNEFKVSSSKEISNISIYDIAGRLISTYNGVNNMTFATAFNRVEGVYIAKISLTDGSIVTEKLINKQ